MFRISLSRARMLSYTHYVANHRLTSEMSEQICKDENVLEVTGEYTCGIVGGGVSHEPRHSNKQYEYDYIAAK